jgi:hypothetical protein
MDAKQLHDLGQQLRVDAVHAAAAAGSGHPTSSMSAADLMAVLLAEHQAPRITKLAVHAMPGSAAPGEQLHAAGIDAKAIEAAARALAGDRVAR